MNPMRCSKFGYLHVAICPPVYLSIYLSNIYLPVYYLSVSLTILLIPNLIPAEVTQQALMTNQMANLDNDANETPILILSNNDRVLPCSLY